MSSSELKLLGRQSDVVDFLIDSHWAVGACDTGTGKTVMSLEAFNRTGKSRLLVICPTFLVGNWHKEAEKWCPGFKVYSVTAPGNVVGVAPKSIVIVGYSRLVQIMPSLWSQIDAVIADECQSVINSESQRTQLFMLGISAAMPEYVWLLSATPARNNSGELHTIMYLMDVYHKTGLNEKYKNRWYFCEHFCNVKYKFVHGREVAEYSGVRNPEELHAYQNKLKFIRISIKDTGAFVPKVLEAFHTSTAVFSGDKALETAFQLERAVLSEKRESALCKIPDTLELLKDLHEVCGAIVVFSDHPEVCVTLQRLLPLRSAAIFGGTPMKKRTAIVEAFQAGKIDFLFCTIGSMGVGVTLTASSTIVFNDLSYVPADNQQALARIVRIGQKFNVVAWYVERAGIDSRIGQILRRKAKDLRESAGGKTFGATPIFNNSKEPSNGKKKYDPPERRARDRLESVKRSGIWR
jgi:SNF2 family DNA or RNA helicase